MASTPLPLPPTAGSQPYSGHAALPPLNTNFSNKKRSAADGTPAPALKRRKGSQMSAVSLASNHPLRQTSFPPDEAQGTPRSARSPSVDMDTASLVSGSAVSSAMPFKKKRGRKSKAELARQQTPSGVCGSSVNGRAAKGGAGTGQKSVIRGEGDEDGEEEEDDAPVAAGTAATTDKSQAERDEEKRLRAAMSNSLDADQFERYSAWRIAKLGDQPVRRLINQTVSQSVPKDVITATRTVTKYFLADLISSAREIQKEWAHASKDERGGDPFPGKVLARGEPEVREEYQQQAEMYEFKPLPSGTEWRREHVTYIRKEEPVGPLLPDHLREAYRRYKRTVQNNAVGIHGLWHTQQSTGVERFPIKTGGRRIFR